jgi:hypothetical protein
MQDYRLTIRGPADVTGPVPVTGGIPLPEGEAPVGTSFVLHGPQGPTATQTTVLGTWPDGSIRWLLVDAVAPAGDYVLRTGAAPQSEVPVTASGMEISQAGIALRMAGSDLQLAPGVSLCLEAVDAAGNTYTGEPNAVEIELSGPVRSTLAWSGEFRDADGQRLFSCRLRASVYAGTSLVLVQPMILVDPAAGVLCNLRELRLRLAVAGAVTASIGGEPGWQGDAAAGARLFQRDDEQYELGDASGTKAPGWAELRSGTAGVALALREFWQQWPKSLEIGADGLVLGLLPAFQEGDFAHMLPDYKHQWFFAGETYQLRTGQARSWDIWLDMAGDGESLTRLANRPPCLIADPAQAIASGVWDDIQPAGSPGMEDYDPWAEQLFHCYRHSVEVQRDYGAMNWGDWFGERRINWGNHEYDTTNQLLLQFARTGDPEYLYWGEAAGRHSAEVDTVHALNPELVDYFKPWTRDTYPPRPGLVHQHAHGHVGGFTDEETVRDWLRAHGVGAHTSRPYTCLDPYNLGHVWTTGLMRLYFLTGNPFLKETVQRVADNLAQLVEDRQYQFMGGTHCGRMTGWPMLALGGAYELDLDQRYVDAMRTLAEDALDMQDPVCGGWIVQPMAADHCICKKARHTGMATFITSVLINGMSRYYELTGDERLPPSIDEAVTYVNNDTWRENLKGWRYTSCPAHRTANQAGVIVMAYVNAVRITKNPEHLRILRLAWEEKFRKYLAEPLQPAPGVGKSYTATMYGCPEAASLFAGMGGGVE